MKAIDKRIAARLLALGELSEADLQRALSEYGGSGSFAAFLLQRGFAGPEAVCRAEAEVNGFEFFDLHGFEPEEGLLAQIPSQMALDSRVFPVALEGETLVLAMGDPSDVLSQDSLRLRLRRAVRMVVAPREELEERLMRYYGPRPVPAPAGAPRSSSSQRVPASAVEHALREAAHTGETPLPESISQAQTARFEESSTDTLNEVEERRRALGAYEVAGDGSERQAVSFPSGEGGQTLRQLFERAMESRAAELELLPGRTNSRVRHRIRGLWHEAPGYPAELHGPVVEALLEMAGLESDAGGDEPVDRQLLVDCPGRGDLLAVLFVEQTAARGARVLLRLAENMPLLGRPLSGVGLPAELAEELNGRLAGKGGGLLLLTSPDLRALQLVYHSLLRSLTQRGMRDVLSLERRAERRLPGVVSLNCPIEGVRLASLSNAAFMVPDVLGIEQVENGTVFNRAINVAVQGTTVVATLRAPSSEAARASIAAARVDPVNIVRGFIGNLHIHVAPRLCQQCCRPITGSRTLPGWARSLDTAFYEAAGCGYCQETGYAGTIYMAEYWAPDLDPGAAGKFRPVVDQREQLVSASVAGQVDPRHFPVRS